MLFFPSKIQICAPKEKKSKRKQSKTNEKAYFQLFLFTMTFFILFIYFFFFFWGGQAQLPCRTPSQQQRCNRGNVHIVSWEPGRALMQFKDVPLRTRRALLLYKVYGNSALLVLNGTSLICNNALLALNWRHTFMPLIKWDKFFTSYLFKIFIWEYFLCPSALVQLEMNVLEWWFFFFFWHLTATPISWGICFGIFAILLI